jgi:hypothetical protein
VEGSRDEFLAGAGFARDEHRKVALDDPVDLLEEASEGGGFTEDFRVVVLQRRTGRGRRRLVGGRDGVGRRLRRCDRESPQTFGVFEGERRLIGEGFEQVLLAVAVDPLLEAVVDVDRADDAVAGPQRNREDRTQT